MIPECLLVEGQYAKQGICQSNQRDTRCSSSISVATIKYPDKYQQGGGMVYSAKLPGFSPLVERKSRQALQRS